MYFRFLITAVMLLATATAANAQSRLSPSAVAVKAGTDASKAYDQEDYTAAMPLAKQACDAGMLDGCRVLGSLYNRGLGGVPKDVLRAASLLQQACDGRNFDGCTRLGLIYQKGAGISLDPAKAAELHKLACDNGVPAGCSNLGTLYEVGAGVPKDLLRSAGLYLAACDKNFAIGCNNLGQAYMSGRGVAKDAAKGEAYLRRALAIDPNEANAKQNIAALESARKPPASTAKPQPVPTLHGGLRASAAQLAEAKKLPWADAAFEPQVPMDNRHLGRCIRKVIHSTNGYGVSFVDLVSNCSFPMKLSARLAKRNAEGQCVDRKESHIDGFIFGPGESQFFADNAVVDCIAEFEYLAPISPSELPDDSFD